MGERDRQLKAQEMADEAGYKMHLIDYNTQMAKIAAKNSENDEAKIKADATTKDWEIAQAGYKMVVKYATNPDGTLDERKYKTGIKNMMINIHDRAPGAMQLLGSLAEQTPGMGDTQAAMNQTAVQAMRGTLGGGQPGQPSGGGFIMKDVSFDDEGNAKPTFSNLDAVTAQANAAEQGKPFTGDEAGVISKSQDIPPLIDELTGLLNKGKGPLNNLYGVMPFGANRISAFGEGGNVVSAIPNAIARTLTAGKGREAGLLLQKIKVLAFGEGGKNLTEGEKAVVYAALNPTNKTEDQWVKDLEYTKKLLIHKAELMTKPRGQTMGNTRTLGDSNIRVVQGKMFERRSDGKWYPKQ